MSAGQRYLRSQRLRSEDIESLLTSGRRLRDDGVVMHVRRNALDAPRLGLIVPKRVVGHAVERNRFKRVTREWFRLHQEHIGGRDILVRLTARPTDFLAAVVRLMAKLP